MFKSKNQPEHYITLLIIFRVLRSVSAGMIILAFPYLVLTELHHSPFRLGLIYTSATIATAALGLLSGFMADTRGRKVTLVIVALLLPLSSLLVYFSKSLLSLFIAAMLGGFSATGSLAGGGVGGAAVPIQSSILAALASGRRTFYFSLVAFISSMAAALGSLLVKVLTINDTFLFAAAISMASIFFILPIRSEEPKGSLIRLKSKVAIGKFLLTGMLNGLSQGLITPFIVPFFVIVYHLPKSEMATYAFISGLIGSLSLLLAPRLEGRFGFVKSINLTRGIGAVLTVLLPVIRVLPVSAAIYFLMPALRVAALPIQQSLMTEMVAQDEFGRAFGINQIARLAASAGGTLFTGYIFSIYFIALPFYLYGALTSMNIYLYSRFFKSKA